PRPLEAAPGARVVADTDEHASQVVLDQAGDEAVASERLLGEPQGPRVLGARSRVVSGRGQERAVAVEAGDEHRMARPQMSLGTGERAFVDGTRLRVFAGGPEQPGVVVEARDEIGS